MNKKIKWTDNSPLLDEGINPKASVASFMHELTTSKIKRYVENQVKDFQKENHISQKRWFKYGVITECPDEIACKSYILYYKTPFRKLKRKITIKYNMVV